jgi:hypothetical protein
MNEFKLKKMTSHKEPVQIFSGSTWEAEMLKSLLESEGITGYLLNEAGTVFPFETTETGTAAVKVMVDPSDYEAAKMVAENYRSNTPGARN